MSRRSKDGRERREYDSTNHGRRNESGYRNDDKKLYKDKKNHNEKERYDERRNYDDNPHYDDRRRSQSVTRRDREKHRGFGNYRDSRDPRDYRGSRRLHSTYGSDSSGRGRSPKDEYLRRREKQRDSGRGGHRHSSDDSSDSRRKENRRPVSRAVRKELRSPQTNESTRETTTASYGDSSSKLPQENAFPPKKTDQLKDDQWNSNTTTNNYNNHKDPSTQREGTGGGGNWGNEQKDSTGGQWPSSGNDNFVHSCADGLDSLVSRMQNMERPAPAGLVPFKRNFFYPHPKTENLTWEEVEAIREAEKIFIEVPEDSREVPKPIISFHLSPFCKEINAIFKQKGFAVPTAIQQQGWPVALSGKDLIGIAETGSGKTLAFILPALVHIDCQPPLADGAGPIALVLAPTRELAMQIGAEASSYARAMNQTVKTLFGQMPDAQQAKRECRNGKVHLIVGCPGKLMDFISQGIFNCNRVTYFVLDEADRLLEMGFKQQIDAIDHMIRDDRQVLMWSATWPSDVEMLGKKVFHQRQIEKPVHIRIGAKGKAVDNITQNFKRTNNKENDLCALLRMKQCLTLVFVKTKRQADQLAQGLQYKNVGAAKLHGDCEQSQRTEALTRFRKKEIQVLVCTEAFSRGLDISNVGLVVLYDCPQEIDIYVHGIGRTARAGMKGESMTFIADGDQYNCPSFFRKILGLLDNNRQVIPDWLREMCGQKSSSWFS